MPSIAFITCESKPLLTPDDQHLASTLGWMGWSVIPTPWTGDVDWANFDLILVRSAWDYHLRADEFRAWINDLRSRSCLFNSPELLLWNIHKRYLLDLRNKGVRIPPTVLATKGSAQSLKEILRVNGWNKAVIKPAISATAYQTWITTIESGANDQGRFEGQLNGADILVQQFLPEISAVGELSMIYFAGEFSHAVIKRAKHGDFRVQSDFGGTAERVDVSAEVAGAGKHIVRCAPRDSLYARVDGVMIEGEFVLMELELIEPCLFFGSSVGSVATMASKIDALYKGKGFSFDADITSNIIDLPKRFRNDQEII
jgi:hypothetical protein